MGLCISNKSNKSKKTKRDFVIRYDPSSSTTLYKEKKSGIINFFKNKFGKHNKKYIEVVNINMNAYRDFTNDKIIYTFS